MLTGLAGCVVALSIEAAIVAEFFPPGKIGVMHSLQALT
jgi:hypothetical protein